MKLLTSLALLRPARRPDHRAHEQKSAMPDGRREGESDNPYFSARRTWNSVIAAEKASRAMWQVIGVAAMLVALASVGGITYVAGQPKFVPYVVEVNKLGEHVAVARADRAAPADPRILRAMLAAWIADARIVTPDIALQRKAVFRIYAMLAPNDPATAKMTEHLNGSETNNPFKRAEKETVSVEVETPLQQTPETWQVDWTETTRERQDGQAKTVQRWRALVTVYLVEPTPQTTEAELRDNPFGVRVRDYSWAKQR